MHTLEAITKVENASAFVRQAKKLQNWHESRSYMSSSPEEHCLKRSVQSSEVSNPNIMNVFSHDVGKFLPVCVLVSRFSPPDR